MEKAYRDRLQHQLFFYSDPLHSNSSRRRRKPAAISCFFCQLSTQIRQFKENPLKDQRKTGLQQPPTILFFLMIMMKGG
jgi:hypothetical protein